MHHVVRVISHRFKFEEKFYILAHDVLVGFLLWLHTSSAHDYSNLAASYFLGVAVVQLHYRVKFRQKTLV